MNYEEIVEALLSIKTDAKSIVKLTGIINEQADPYLVNAVEVLAENIERVAAVVADEVEKASK